MTEKTTTLNSTKVNAVTKLTPKQYKDLKEIYLEQLEGLFQLGFDQSVANVLPDVEDYVDFILNNVILTTFDEKEIKTIISFQKKMKEKTARSIYLTQVLTNKYIENNAEAIEAHLIKTQGE